VQKQFFLKNNTSFQEKRSHYFDSDKNLADGKNSLLDKGFFYSEQGGFGSNHLDCGATLEFSKFNYSNSENCTYSTDK